MSTDTKEFLKKETDKIWFAKPADVSHLSKVLGAFEQSGSVKIYAHGETSALVDVLTRLQKILADGLVETPTLSIVAGGILDAYAEQWPRYYRFKEIPKVLEQVARCLKTPITSKSELDEILSLCVRYIYRVHFWIDTEIPWKAVTDLFR
jgi:hypothetical protein